MSRSLLRALMTAPKTGDAARRLRRCSLHDFSRETFMQRKLAVACATLCNTTLALAYSVSKLVNVNYGQKSYLLRKSWRFRSQVLKPVCRK